MYVEILSLILTAVNLFWSNWLKTQSDRAKTELEHVLKAQAKIEAHAATQDKKIESLTAQLNDKNGIIHKLEQDAHELAARVKILEADKLHNERVIAELKTENATLKEMVKGARLV